MGKIGIKDILGILIFAFKNRDKLAGLKKEALDVKIKIDAAKADGKFDKEEVKDILTEAGQVNDLLIKLLSE